MNKLVFLSFLIPIQLLAQTSNFWAKPYKYYEIAYGYGIGLNQNEQNMFKLNLGYGKGYTSCVQSFGKIENHIQHIIWMDSDFKKAYEVGYSKNWNFSKFYNGKGINKILTNNLNIETGLGIEFYNRTSLIFRLSPKLNFPLFDTDIGDFLFQAFYNLDYLTSNNLKQEIGVRLSIKI